MGEYLYSLIRAVIVHVRIDGTLDGPALLQFPEVLDEQIRIESVGVVIVLTDPLLVCRTILPFVVAVVTDDGDVTAKVFLQMLGQCGLTGAGTPGDADDDRAHTFCLPPIRFCLLMFII